MTAITQHKSVRMTPVKTAGDKAQTYLHLLYSPSLGMFQKPPNPTQGQWGKPTSAFLCLYKSHWEAILVRYLMAQHTDIKLFYTTYKKGFFSVWPNNTEAGSPVSCQVSELLLLKSSLSAQWSESLVPLDLLCPFICPAGGRLSDSCHHKYLQIVSKQLLNEYQRYFRETSPHQLCSPANTAEFLWTGHPAPNQADASTRDVTESTIATEIFNPFTACRS